MSDEREAPSGWQDPFDLRPGMIVEVTTPADRLLFAGRLYSSYDGVASIRELNDEELPMVLVGKPVKLGFFRERDKLVLRGKVCSSTKRMWKIDQLENVFTQEHRTFFRQSTGVELAAQCGRPGEPTVPCQVLDVSAGGMLISCKEEFRQDERLSITEVPLVAGQPTFAFECTIRRASLWKKGVYRYGCQFETLSHKEQDALLRAIFALQREEIRKHRAQ